MYSKRLRYVTAEYINWLEGILWQTTFPFFSIFLQSPSFICDQFSLSYIHPNLIPPFHHRKSSFIRQLNLWQMTSKMSYMELKDSARVSLGLRSMFWNHWHHYEQCHTNSVLQDGSRLVNTLEYPIKLFILHRIQSLQNTVLKNLEICSFFFIFMIAFLQHHLQFVWQLLEFEHAYLWWPGDVCLRHTRWTTGWSLLWFP